MTVSLAWLQDSWYGYLRTPLADTRQQWEECSLILVCSLYYIVKMTLNICANFCSLLFQTLRETCTDTVVQTFSIQYRSDEGSSRMCLNIKVTRARKPWNAEACVRLSSSRGPPSSANCTAYLCFLVRRSIKRKAACRVPASTGTSIMLTIELKTWKKATEFYIYIKSSTFM